jgi:hypothetical protein
MSSSDDISAYLSAHNTVHAQHGADLTWSDELLYLPRHNQTLGPAARDSFAILGGLCLLGNDEGLQFLQLEYLHKTFALKLIESVLTNYHDLFCKVRSTSRPCACQITSS